MKLFIFTTSLFLLKGATALSTTLHVPSQYATIQKAIDMAQDWDTIKVAPGTYVKSIIVNKRNIIILGDFPETTILDAGGAPTTVTLVADNVEINGFTITNGNDNGILMVNSSGNRIVNCVFPDNSYDLNLTNSRNNVLRPVHIQNLRFR